MLIAIAGPKRSGKTTLADGLCKVFSLEHHSFAGPIRTLFKDFAAATLSDASAQLILSLQQGGLITKETALREQQRRGVLSPEIDIAVEVAVADAEGHRAGHARHGRRRWMAPRKTPWASCSPRPRQSSSITQFPKLWAARGTRRSAG